MECGEQADKAKEDMTGCLPMVRAAGGFVCLLVVRRNKTADATNSTRSPHPHTLCPHTFCSTHTHQQYEALQSCMEKNKEVFDALLAEMKAEEAARGLGDGDGDGGEGSGSGGSSAEAAAAAAAADSQAAGEAAAGSAGAGQAPSSLAPAGDKSEK